MSDPREPRARGRQAGGGEASPTWVPSPLLLKPQQTPRFLRAAWDQKAAHAFGPWRVGAPVDPALAGHELAAPAFAAGEGAALAHAGGDHPLPDDTRPGDTEVIDVQARAVHDGQALPSEANPEALAAAEARGHARGLEEGRAQALAELEAERAREAELIRHLAIELRALSDAPDRFFEPLRRLALHIAEQLVRGELRASPDAISQIVRQALAALDPSPGAQVLVCVHPEDAAVLQSASPSFLEGLKLQPEPQLHRGSVRLRLDDTVLEDLVENRLQALVDRLLVHTGASRESVLTRDFGAALRRGAAVDDVIDTTARPMPETPPEEPQP